MTCLTILDRSNYGKGFGYNEKKYDSGTGFGFGVRNFGDENGCGFGIGCEDGYREIRDNEE